MKKINILILFLTFIFVPKAIAMNIDDLIAKTSIALGDEYLKEASKIEPEVLALLKGQNVSFEERLSLNNSIIADYENFRNLAILEYRNVFCTSFCPEGLGNLRLSSDYVFYRREAHSKAEIILSGSLASGVLLKRASIYAVNGEFEEHLLGRLYGLISSQQSYDQVAKNLNKQLLDLQSAYVNEAGQIIGVDQSLFRDSNYQLTQQSQYQGYKSCVDSYKSQDQFESSEYKKSLEQYELLRSNLINNLYKIYDFTYSNSAGDKAFKVYANSDWSNTNTAFEPNDKVALLASGKWAARSAALVFKEQDLYRYSNSYQTQGFFKKIVNFGKSLVKTGVFGPLPALFLDVISGTEAKVLKEVKDNSNNVIQKIAHTALDAGPEGYYFSFSNSLSKSVSSGEGTSMNGSVGFAGFVSLGGGTSESSGESTSSSAGTGGTYGLKLNTTVLPIAPLGSLIGSFCAHDPSLGGCPFFEIGTGGTFTIESSIGENATLWVRVNDKTGSLSANAGNINLEVRKSTSFKNYLDQYYEWMNQECDENGENCGLMNILENIAYIPNPTETINAIFVKKFPDFPSDVKSILMSEIGYMIQMNVIQRDLKNKEHSQELNDVKVTYCKEQVRLTEESIKQTSELIRTYSNMAENSQTKRLLLDTAKKFYEKELESLNWIRGKNLERIERYYNITINAFNYLYFADYQPVGTLLPYEEGNYYKENVERMRDQIIDITTVNDLLNPNRGFVVYELSSDELASLQDTNFRNRKTQVRVRLEDVMCDGFGLDNQTRVMVEKVGVLLDLDPAREHLFFSNNHVRNTKPLITHGSENRFFDLMGLETEYWMPPQKRNINAWSTQVLVDTNSDYQELRNSRYFERQSFRKTSFASTWNVELTDPTLRMYTSGNSEPVLKGMKLVFWFNSTETQGNDPVNVCTNPPMSFVQKNYDPIERKVTLEWEIPKEEVDIFNVSDFSIYQAGNSNTGYRVKEELAVSNCIDNGDNLKCEKEIDLSRLTLGQSAYFKIRSGYRKENQEKVYYGHYSEPIQVTAE